MKKKKYGVNNSHWKGGKHIDWGGYVKILDRFHPNASKGGYVAEHTCVMAEFLGRPLKKGESVHHKNGIRNDNRIENLELCSKFHPSGQKVNDMIDFCLNYLSFYKPDLLKNPIEEQDNVLL